MRERKNDLRKSHDSDLNKTDGCRRVSGDGWTKLLSPHPPHFLRCYRLWSCSQPLERSSLLIFNGPLCNSFQRLIAYCFWLQQFISSLIRAPRVCSWIFLIVACSGLFICVFSWKKEIAKSYIGNWLGAKWEMGVRGNGWMHCANKEKTDPFEIWVSSMRVSTRFDSESWKTRLRLQRLKFPRLFIWFFSTLFC